MLPAAVVIGTLSAGLSARLIGRFGLRSMLVTGLAPIVVGFALLTRLPAAGSYPLHLLQTMLLLGGFGLAFPAMIALAMSGVPGSDAGVASGLVNTTQQVGAALGVAMLSTLAAARTGHLLTAGRPAADALTGATTWRSGPGPGWPRQRPCSPWCRVQVPPGAGLSPRTGPGGRTGSVPIVGRHHDRPRALASLGPERAGRSRPGARPRLRVLARHPARAAL